MKPPKSTRITQNRPKSPPGGFHVNNYAIKKCTNLENLPNLGNFNDDIVRIIKLKKYNKDMLAADLEP